MTAFAITAPWVDWDTETALIRPGMQAPELACLQFIEHDSQGAQLLDPANAADAFELWLDSPGLYMAGHSISYDTAVMCAHDPRRFLHKVFDAYEAGRFYCTQLAEQQIRAAFGKYRGYRSSDDVWHPAKYTLQALAQAHARIELDKPDANDPAASVDHWRLRYGTLIGVPVPEWPEPAIKYAKDDAIATRAVRVAQLQIVETFRLSRPDPLAPESDLLIDLPRQAYADFVLRLTSIWGIRSDNDSIDHLAKVIGDERDRLAQALQAEGLVRADGTRDMAVVRQAVYDAYEDEGRTIPRTKTWNNGYDAKKERPRELTECVATDADTCDQAHSPLLDDYARFVQLGTMVNGFLPMLRKGSHWPIHTRFGYAVTGRSTSSGPNIQNFGRDGGVRECIVARPGKLILQLDVPGLELHTFGECATEWLGESRMAQLLIQRIDVHSFVGAEFAGVPYEEFMARSDELKIFRQTAKPFNFGRLGGMGEKRFIPYARKSSGGKVNLTRDEYHAHNRSWLRAIPEAPRWFDLAKRRADYANDQKATVLHLYSNRWRGDCGFTDACNTPFQGLGADLAKRCTVRIGRACYADENSPLFSCRLINFIHDEWLLEIPDDGYAHERAEALADIVHFTLNEWLRHVPFYRDEFKPVLMRRWGKGAKAAHDAAGRLVLSE